MIVWMEITLDKYEFPKAVADTRKELAEIIGVRPKSISEHISRCKRLGIKCRYIKVEIEDE